CARTETGWARSALAASRWSGASSVDRTTTATGAAAVGGPSSRDATCGASTTRGPVPLGARAARATAAENAAGPAPPNADGARRTRVSGAALGERNSTASTGDPAPSNPCGVLSTGTAPRAPHQTPRGRSGEGGTVHTAVTVEPPIL